MENTFEATAQEHAHEAATLSSGDPTNPDLIKLLRAEEILAETPQPAIAIGTSRRGTPTTVDGQVTGSASHGAN